MLLNKLVLEIQMLKSDLFEIIRDASINFDEMISGKFRAVDKILRNSSLGVMLV